ncbi:hypothetical protein AKG07_09470 [Microbacterium sp. CGR1]|nr:hypothetical protein AKG07_09470 [Microbacterium sp. CGR1]
MITPTETRAMVDTETTRRPAISTGPARGNSTRQNRPLREKPMAFADSMIDRSTDPKASVAERSMIATA